MAMELDVFLSKMNLNFSSICRICLEEGILKSIFKTIRKTEVSKATCSEMIVRCASVTAHENDGLPQQICTKCVSKLKSAFAFRTRCEESFNLLSKYIQTELNKPHIKAELCDDSAYNSLASTNVEIKYEDVELKEEKPDNVFERLELPVDDTNDSVKAFEVDDYPSSEDPDYDQESISIADKKLFKKRKKKTKRDLEIVIKSKSHKPKDKSNEILGIDVKSLKIGNGRYQCNQCPRIFLSKRGFIRHLEKHLGIKSFFCEICQKYYAREWVHMQTHTRPRSKSFQCEHCTKLFETKGALNTHMIVHSDAKPHVCDDCGKSFKRMDRLTFHKKIHSGIKEYICQFCSKDFYMQKNLFIHIKYKHTNDRQYQCTLCEKKFVTGNCLKIHERRHLSIKNYQCDLCDKTFVAQSGLQTHMKMHTKEKHHPCRVCAVKFKRTDHRNRHEMSAHGMDFRKPKTI